MSIACGSFGISSTNCKSLYFLARTSRNTADTSVARLGTAGSIYTAYWKRIESAISTPGGTNPFSVFFEQEQKNMNRVNAADKGGGSSASHCLVFAPLDWRLIRWLRRIMSL